MRRWLFYLALVLVAAMVAVWQFVYHGVDPALIFDPPPRRVAPPDLSARVSIDAKQRRLDDVLDEFAQQSGVTIEFDATALYVPGGSATQKIDLTLDDVPLDQAIQLALSKLSDPEYSYYVTKGQARIIHVRKWRNEQRSEPRIYPTAELLAHCESISPNALAKAVNAICDVCSPAATEDHCRCVPAGLLVTATPEAHQKIAALFAALLRERPTPGQLRQVYWPLDQLAPSAALLAQLDTLVDVDLDNVPLAQLPKELERQCGIEIRSQFASHNEPNAPHFTLHARQQPVREVLARLGHHYLGFAPHGDLVWMSPNPTDGLETGHLMHHVALYPVGDLLRAVSHPSAPQAAGDFAGYFAQHHGEYPPGQAVLVGDVLVSCSHTAPEDADLLGELHALRRTLLERSTAASDWRGYLALSQRLKQPLNVVCDQSRLSQRLAKLAEISRVPIELAAQRDASMQTEPAWQFKDESINDKLEYYLAWKELHAYRTVTGLTIDREYSPSGYSFHRLESLLSATRGRLDIDQARTLLHAVYRRPQDYFFPIRNPDHVGQPGAVFRMHNVDPAAHFAVAEMIDKLCEHARHPDDVTPWTIESLRGRITVFPVGDLRETFAGTSTIERYRSELISRAGPVVSGDYIVAQAEDREYVERLLAALRDAPQRSRKGLALTNVPEGPEFEARGVIAPADWDLFESNERYTLLYYAPELARLHRPLIESWWPPLPDSRWSAAQRAGLASPASASALWRPIGRDLAATRWDTAVEALLGRFPTIGNDYQWFGDHIAVTCSLAGHARFRRQLQRLADPARLHDDLPTITLRADGEPLRVALDRWSRAARRPIVVLRPLDERLELAVTIDVVDQPLASFVREHFDGPSESLQAEVLDDDAAIVIGPRGGIIDPLAGTARLYDLRACQAKLPEMDGRQLVQWLVEATGYERWKNSIFVSSAEHALEANSLSLTPVGNVLVARHNADMHERIASLLAFLGSDEIDQLPRPALLFADDAAEAKRQFVKALIESEENEPLVTYAAFWLNEGPALDEDDLAPLVNWLDELHLPNPDADFTKLQAICRVLAAHRASAGAALAPLIRLCQSPTSEHVHTTLLAALASLGEPAIMPLMDLLPKSSGEHSQQIIRYLALYGDAARPVVPKLLEWAYVGDAPEDTALILATLGHSDLMSPGLLLRLDPKAEVTRKILGQWREHRDSAYREAFQKADQHLHLWPAYSGAIPY